MRRVLKQAAIFFTLLAVAAVVFFPWSIFSEDIVQGLKSEADRAGILLDIESAELGLPPRIKFNSPSALIPSRSLPIPLRLDSVEFRLKLLPLFIGKVDFIGKVSGYGGTLDFGWNQRLSGSEPVFEVDLKQLKLQEHPVLAGLGLQGLLDIKGRGELESMSNGMLFAKNGDLDLTISQANVQGGYQIQGLFTVPKIDNLSGKIIVNEENFRASLSKFSFDSSLGKADGHGSASFSPEGVVKRLKASFSISLTPEGVTALGGYLALAAGENVETPKSLYRVSVEINDNSKPIVTVRGE